METGKWKVDELFSSFKFLLLISNFYITGFYFFLIIRILSLSSPSDSVMISSFSPRCI
jgi:hypothetical protein